jgi:aminopeptidase N
VSGQGFDEFACAWWSGSPRVGPHNLTDVEALERSRLIGDVEYDISLDLSSIETFESTCLTRFRCKAPGASTFLDVPESDSLVAEFNGTDLSGQVSRGRLPLVGLRPVNEVKVQARMHYSTNGFGLIRYRDPRTGEVVIYSQLEPFFAHTVFACFDQPDIRARFTLRVTAPWSTIVTNTPAEPAPSTDANFRQTQPISPYLFAIVAGDLHSEVCSTGGRDYGFFCRPSSAGNLDARALAMLTADGLQFFEQLLGMPYPYEKYDQIFLPEFYNPSGMEHPGCVTLSDSFILPSEASAYDQVSRALMILHEMAHMWFGDFVSIRWWNDLWLKEGMATYMAHEAMSSIKYLPNAWSVFANGLKNWAYRQDQLPGTHPVVGAVPDVQTALTSFDGITYAKGAAVIRQLSALLNRDDFMSAISQHLRARACESTDWPETMAALAEHAGDDLSEWSSEWLRNTGVNDLAPTYTVRRIDGTEVIESFAVQQGSLPTRTHRFSIGFYRDNGDGGPLERYVGSTVVVAGPTTVVHEFDGQARPLIVILNDDDATYGKVRFNTDALIALANHLRRLPNVVTRSVVWSGLWNMLRDSQFASSDFVQMAVAHLVSENDVILRRTVAVQAIEAVEWLSGEATRVRNGARLAELFFERAADDSEPVTRVESLKWFTLTAIDPKSIDRLRRLLSESMPLPGLRLSQDLRWACLRALSRTGLAGQSEIETEQIRDPTERGRRESMACLVSRPDRDAKEVGWQQVVAGDLGSSSRQAIMSSFWQPDQAAILQVFVRRYFDHLRWLMRRGDTPTTFEFARGLYPAAVPGHELAAETERFIGEFAVQPDAAVVVNLVRQGADEAQRRLRCRQYDSAPHITLFPRT